MDFTVLIGLALGFLDALGWLLSYSWGALALGAIFWSAYRSSRRSGVAAGTGILACFGWVFLSVGLSQLVQHSGPITVAETGTLALSAAFLGAAIFVSLNDIESRLDVRLKNIESRLDVILSESAEDTRDPP